MQARYRHGTSAQDTGESTAVVNGSHHSHSPQHHLNARQPKQVAERRALLLLALACVCALSGVRIRETAAVSALRTTPGCSSPRASAVRPLQGPPLTAHMTQRESTHTQPITKPYFIIVDTGQDEQGEQAMAGCLRGCLLCVRSLM